MAEAKCCTPSYSELCECLWLTVDPEIKGWLRRYGKGAYCTDVERALRGMASFRGGQIHFSKIEEEGAERALRRLAKITDHVWSARELLEAA